MVVAPILLNSLFFWLIDNIIMRKRAVRQTNDSDDDSARKPLLNDERP